MHQDKNMDWGRQRHIVEVSEMNSLGADGNGLAGTAPALGEIGGAGGLGFWGINFSSNSQEIVHAMKVPSTWDFNRDIGVTIEWSTPGQNASLVASWVAEAISIAPGEALALPTGGTNGTSIIESGIFTQATGTIAANVLQETERGVINPGNVERGDRLVFKINRGTATTIPSLILHSLILDYMPKWTRGPGARNNRHYEEKQIDFKY